MLSAIFVGMARHRRLALGGAVVLAAGLLGLRELPSRESIGRPAMVLLIANLPLVAAVLARSSLRQQRPAAFAVDPRTPAFRTLPHARHVCAAVALIFASASQVAFWLLLAEVDQGLAYKPGASVLIGLIGMGSVLSGGVVALSAVYVVAVWRNLGVQLRPDGLIDRQPLGSLIVPWEALAPGYPSMGPPPNNNLALSYARPELVRRRGLIVNWRRIPTFNIHPAFLGSAIAHYVWYSQYRAAIGTQTEYDRLLHVLAGEAPSEQKT